MNKSTDRMTWLEAWGRNGSLDCRVRWKGGPDLWEMEKSNFQNLVVDRMEEGGGTVRCWGCCLHFRVDDWVKGVSLHWVVPLDQKQVQRERRSGWMWSV